MNKELEEMLEDEEFDIDKNIENAFSEEYNIIEIRKILEQVYSFPIDERNMYINTMLNAARKHRCLNAFKEHLGQYKAEYARIQLEQNVTGFASIKNAPEGLEELVFQYKCGDFILNDTGVAKAATTKDGDFVTIPICSQPVLITSRMKNVQDSRENVVITFYSNRWQNITAEREIIASHTKVVQLAGYGLDITSETAKNMVSYFQCILQKNINLISLYSTINRLGWYKGEFIPYSNKIKCDAAENFRDIYNAIDTSGNYEEWKQHCYMLRKNIPLRLTMAASFAAPLILLVGGLPFMLHLWGSTGLGKTVALSVAASVWGNPGKGLVRSLNGTDYGISETAAFLYSLPCIMDELQTIKDNGINYNKLIMQLTEGISRTQGAANNGIKEVRRWQNCFLTNGEENIIEYNSGGGTVNRVISVECSEKIISDGHQTMNIIKENYGHAGIEYIKGLQSEKHLSEKYKIIFKSLVENTDATDKQCMAMSFLILADKLSCDYIFTDSDNLNLSDVLPYMATNKEVDIVDRCLEWLNDWISQNIKRFEHPEENHGEVWGKKDMKYILINKTVLTEHMKAAGFAYSAIIPEFAKRGYILRNSQGKCIHYTTVNLHKASYIKLVRELEDDKDINDILIG